MITSIYLHIVIQKIRIRNMQANMITREALDALHRLRSDLIQEHFIRCGDFTEEALANTEPQNTAVSQC